MNRAIQKLLNPLIHLIATFTFGFLLLNVDGAFTTIFIGMFWFVSLTINALTFVFSFKEGKWRNYFSSIVIYILFILLFFAFKITFGDPGKEVDGNIADGLVAIFVFMLSLTTIVIGNLIGILIKKNKRKGLWYDNFRTTVD